METEFFVALDVRTSARDLLEGEENVKGRFERYNVLLLYIGQHLSSI